MLIIGATIAIVATAATFAQFTDQATATGTVSAGAVDVVLNSDTDDQTTFTFDTSECANLGFGEECTGEIEVENAGSLPFLLLTTAVVTEGEDCFTVSAAPGEGTPAEGEVWEPGQLGTYIVTVTLTDSTPADTSDDEDCNGAEGEVLVTFDATQAEGGEPTATATAEPTTTATAEPTTTATAEPTTTATAEPTSTVEADE